MARPDRATFRLPAWALFLPAVLLFLITPLATADAWWGFAFIVPLVGLAWVVITRTNADASGVTTYGLLGTRRMKWSELDRLEVRDARWVVAVGTEGRRMRLSMVRPHDLRRLIGVSGGSLRVGDTAAPVDEPRPAAVATEQSDAAIPDPIQDKGTRAAGPPDTGDLGTTDLDTTDLGTTDLVGHDLNSRDQNTEALDVVPAGDAGAGHRVQPGSLTAVVDRNSSARGTVR